MFSSPSSSSSSDTSVAVDLGRLRDVVCGVDVVLGTGSITVRQCLALKDGSIIPLEQVAGSDLQVVVNGVPMRHLTWAECERRVKGQSGARFKKATSAADEAAILSGWGIDPSGI